MRVGMFDTGVWRIITFNACFDAHHLGPGQSVNQHLSGSLEQKELQMPADSQGFLRS